MKEETVKSLLMFLGIMFMLIFSLTPFFYMLMVSFSLKPNFLSSKVPFIFTVQNYSDVLANNSLHFLNYLLNSLIISSISAAVCVIIASLGAYSLTRLKLPAKGFILFSILGVSLFPQISLVGYLFKIMTTLGWINTYKALILPYIAWVLPLAVWILVSYFSQIPKELDKAALVDGCRKWQILWKVLIPVAKPGIISVFLLSFIAAFNEFLFALMLTTDYKARTVSVGIALFEGLHGQIPWGNIMAASVVGIAPIIIITIIFQRHIISGLTRGAIKT